MQKLIHLILLLFKKLGHSLRFLSIARPEQPDWRYWTKLTLKRIGIGLFFLAIYFLLVDLNFLWLFGKSPSLDELENPTLDQASEVYTTDGVMLGRYYIANRTPVKFNRISPLLIKGLVATEDARFYQHSGIDFIALPSAVWSSLRGDHRGGSTITQQLAKNLYKTRGGVSEGLFGYIPLINTLISKTKEWITAVKLERRFSKREILTLYLNTVDFGQNSFGIKTAARTYFNTSPDSLNTEEVAMLIGLLKAPTLYSPIKNPKNALSRRNTVLSQMLKYGVINKPEFELAKNTPIELNITIENHFDGPAGYFRLVLNNYLKEWCHENNYDLYTDGLKIYTTIDSKLQQYAEDAVAEHMKTLQKRFEQHWKGKNPWADEHGNEIPGFIDSTARRLDYYKVLRKKFGNQQDSINARLYRPKRMKVFTWNGEKDTTFSTMDSLRYYKHFLNAGFMVMNHHTSEVKAWVGGINYKYFRYDHVKQARRQPGSTFKPILYASAFENGWGPCDKLQDKAVTIRYKEKGLDKTWSPHNADFIFSGAELTLRRAMGRSVNTVAAQVTEAIGWETVIDYAHRMGITSPLDTVPSIGLGSSDVSIYEMTGAYATFMNLGIWTEPIFITKIVDRKGKVYYPKVKRHRAVSEETAWLMQYMLKGGLEEPGGTSQALFEFDLFRGNEFGGKTGTSSNHSDGWFFGVSKDLVGGMWVGGEDRCIHFRTSSMGEGAKTALPIFGKFMEKVYADKSTGIVMGYFPKPPKLNKPCNCRTAFVRSDSTHIVANDSAAVEGMP